MKVLLVVCALVLIAASVEGKGFFYMPETKKAMRQFDENSDGLIEKEEFEGLMKRYGADEDAAVEAGTGADTDKDGIISLNEFVSALRRCREPSFRGLRVFDVDGNKYIRGQEILDTIGQENLLL
uniref:EF-hand domain-containing protein n=1 Tax=Palpitomonas bilix TaxID=652834 RepID=A0A7S3LTS5_9EUKA|mmetsp:Transcript_46203/g.119067  ORF Transcript_46203/g.119067 Transcript_46203/m.119067 type:complete len:125 (+) Transcript_46203:96-470(+)|eukprot:CAMPEP_0113881140 /NCGR_PEP_ID=MMETSP0780_2-20120614/8197_1 /TAXON_ID=652834 /ORGANISM="Palpitomonas bilix" /LENGTH=124 /DNA_ID=CAMNT_0000867937 /DNA_START=36 /DNA_END=410 /DNA_ORIENTATION=+ /assembly_acc=CAM_ASM_000599